MRFFAWKENFAKADALIVENRPLPMFLCRVLASRGIKESASAETFLNCTQPLCDPMELHDMEKAVTIVRRAIDGICERDALLRISLDEDTRTKALCRLDKLKAAGTKRVESAGKPL